MKGRDGLGGSLKRLGGAAGELLGAELSALSDDLGRTGRRLAGALLLLLGALFALFWALGLAIYLAVEVAHNWLPRWGAVALVLGVVVVVLVALAAVGWRRIKRLEPPAVTVRRRWRSHRRWWLDHFAGPAEDGPPSLPDDSE